MINQPGFQFITAHFANTRKTTFRKLTAQQFSFRCQAALIFRENLVIELRLIDFLAHRDYSNRSRRLAGGDAFMISDIHVDRNLHITEMLIN